MEIRLLGPIDVWSEGEHFHPGCRLRTVLATLALDVGHVVPAERLVDVAWGDDPPATASAQLHTAVWQLRRILGDVVETRAPGYALRVERTVIDVAVFDDHLAAGRAAAAAGHHEQAASSLREALSLWRGPALADVPALAAHAHRLDERRLAALEGRIDADLALGEHADLVAELTCLSADNPLRERLQGQLMTALYRSGRSADALEVYRRLRDRLDAEVGLEPMLELRELQRKVLAQDPALLEPATEARPPERGPLNVEPAGAPETRYIKVDGVHIAYQVVGQGDIDIVLVPGLLSHLDLWWEDPVTARFLRRLAALGRLIVFDKRGAGLSDRPARAQTLEDRVDDIRCVMDAADSRRAVLLGYSEGGPMSMLYAASHPERVSGVVLAGAAARWSVADDYPCGRSSEDMLDALERICEHEWGRGRTIEWYAPSVAHSEHARALVARRERMSVGPNDFLQMLRVVRETDVRAVLPSLTMPVLVLQRRDDRITPPCHGRYLADHLPNARYVEQPGDHVIWIGDTDPLLAEVETFVAEVAEVARQDRVLATVLVAHVIDPVHDGAQPVGDRFGGVLDTRTILVHAGGRHVEEDPATLLATFDRPARAIECAFGLEDEAGRRGLKLRAGVHVGEAGPTDGVPTPAARNIATRVAMLGGAGEILVSRTVKDLAVGSGTRFVERGSHLLDDDAERWAVYAVTRT